MGTIVWADRVSYLFYLGKSLLLVLILHMRSLAGSPTVFIQHPDYADVFSFFGIERLLQRHLSKSRLPPSLWVLIDSNMQLKGVPDWVTGLGFVVQAASPTPGRLEWQKKRTGVSSYVLKPWSLEEALAALVAMFLSTRFITDFTHSRALQAQKPSESDLKVFFERYLPSAHTAYSSAAFISSYEMELEQSLRQLSIDDIIDIALNVVAFQIDDKLHHHLFVILPTETRSRHSVEFVSQYCLRTLLRIVKNDKLTSAAETLYQLFSGHSSTRGLAGQVLDMAAPDLFPKGGCWKMQEMEMSPVRGTKNQHWKIQPDSTYADKYLIVGYAHQLVLIANTPPPENTVFCNIATYPFPPTGQGTLRTGYYIPTLKTQATFDAFFYDADKNQAMVLQVTVSPRHSVKEKGIEQLKKWGVQSAHYVAVTGLHDTFDLPVPHEYSPFLKKKYRLVVESVA